MTGLVAKKEILVSLTSVRFIITVIVCCLLMPLSTWVLSNDYIEDQRDHQARVELENRRTEGKNMATVVSRPVPPLSSLFRGVNTQAVNSINLKYYVGWNMPKSVGRQSITSAIFPTVDITFIVGVVLSALALMLSFDAVSGEKAQATLRLMMSNSVPRSSIILGKWVGLSTVVLIPFSLGVVLSLLVYFFITGVSLNGAEAIALVIALLVTAIYLALFVLIGITVSALTKNPALSILVSLGIWGVIVFILPQLSNAVASGINPIRSPQVIERDIRVAYNEMANAMRDKNIEITEKAKRESLPYEEWNPERVRGDFALVKENKITANSIEREYWLEVKEQEKLSRAISSVSPYGALSQAVMSLASTGPATQRAFLEQAYSYGERFFTTIWDLALETDQGWDEILPAQPQFEFQGRSIDERVDDALVPIASIIVLMVVLALVAVLTFNSYDVR